MQHAQQIQTLIQSLQDLEQDFFSYADAIQDFEKKQQEFRDELMRIKEELHISSNE